MSGPLRALAGIVEQAWLVGGALRDRLLGRPTADYDVAVAVAGEGSSGDDVQRTARALGRAAGGFAFALSETFGAWRVVSHSRSWQVDLTPLAGATIEADLALRDLTVNAVAQPLGGDEALVDPFGGLEDLRLRRLRSVSPDAFERDPLRSLRLVRLACELEFSVDPDTLGLARASAPGLRGVAPERVFAELRRVLSAEQALDGLDLMDATAVTAAILPELVELRGIDQSRFHHLDAFEHTRAVLAETIALERDPEPAFGEDAAAVLALLSEPLANELTRGQALRFGALLHDIAKPQTRAETPEGRVTFMRHDEAGAQLSAAILARLRASDRLAEYVGGLTRHHLRLGFLIHRMPLSRRETYRYLDACAPVQVDVTVLSVADRLATRGDGAERATLRHLELARLLMHEALAWRADPPRPPIRGDQLSRALGIAPGPQLGELLRELEEASYAGEISSREDAVAHARRRMGRGG
ncbi:MAG: HDIG domain-containing metalloprotein [Solirubrobacteraceae bacterium]